MKELKRKIYDVVFTVSVGISSNQLGVSRDNTGVCKCTSLALGVMNGSSLVIACRYARLSESNTSLSATSRFEDCTYKKC